MRFALLSIAALQEHLTTEEKPVEKVTMKDMRKALTAVSAEDVESMFASQAYIYSGILMSGDVLYIPQGWLVVEQTVSLLACGICTNMVTAFSKDIAVVADLSRGVSASGVKACFCTSMYAQYQKEQQRISNAISNKGPANSPAVELMMQAARAAAHAKPPVSSVMLTREAIDAVTSGASTTAAAGESASEAGTTAAAAEHVVPSSDRPHPESAAPLSPGAVSIHGSDARDDGLATPTFNSSAASTTKVSTQAAPANEASAPAASTSQASAPATSATEPEGSAPAVSTTEVSAQAASTAVVSADSSQATSTTEVIAPEVLATGERLVPSNAEVIAPPLDLGNGPNSLVIPRSREVRSDSDPEEGDPLKVAEVQSEKGNGKGSKKGKGPNGKAKGKAKPKPKPDDHEQSELESGKPLKKARGSGQGKAKPTLKPDADNDIEVDTDGNPKAKEESKAEMAKANPTKAAKKAEAPVSGPASIRRFASSNRASQNKTDP